MKKNLPVVFIFYILILSSCANQKPAYIPEVDGSYPGNERTVSIDTRNIIDTKDGLRISLPRWLSAYLSGGINAVEAIPAYSDKYTFVAVHQGESFTALNIWADRFSVKQDFSMLAGARIERKIITSSTMYPDYEYGVFFERLVKESYSGEFPGVIKEDTYWIKTRTNNEMPVNDSSEIYMFFILLTIDKFSMQNMINGMMTQTQTAVSPTRAQIAAINRLRQNFYTGF